MDPGGCLYYGIHKSVRKQIFCLSKIVVFSVLVLLLLVSPTTAEPSDYFDALVQDGVYQWPVTKFPIKVYLEPGEGISGYRSNFNPLLRAAFDAWTEASNGRLSWIEVKEKSKADVVCRWSNVAKERAEGTEAGNTKTYTLFNTQTNCGTIKRATMDLLTRLPERIFTDAEIQKTTLHEVGHAFGVACHSPQRHDIMFAAVSASQDPQLSDRDISTINRLYAGYPRHDQIGNSQISHTIPRS